MAIPPPEVRNSRNILRVERLAELGWVSKRQARAAIAEAKQRAVGGALGDALEILRDLGLVDDEIEQALDRDEAAPVPPVWKRWAARPFGPVACFGAPPARLLEAVIGGLGVPSCQQDRAKTEIKRRLRGSDDERSAMLESLRSYDAGRSDALVKLVRRLLEGGFELPDVVLHDVIVGAAKSSSRDWLFRTMFQMLPEQRLRGVVGWLDEAPPSAPFSLTGRWSEAADSLDVIAPLVDQWLARSGWREPILDVARQVRADDGPHPLDASLPVLLSALTEGDPSAAATIAEIGSPECVVALQDQLEAGSPRVRMAAAIGLIDVGETDAFDVLNELMDVPGVRRHLRAEMTGSGRDPVAHPGARGRLRPATDDEMLHDSVLSAVFANEPDEPATVKTLGSVDQTAPAGGAQVHLLEITRHDGDIVLAYKVVVHAGRVVPAWERGQAGLVPSWQRQTDLESLAAFAIAQLPRPIG